MQKLTQYAIFNYEESEREIIDALATYLDEKAQDIYNFFEEII